MGLSIFGPFLLASIPPSLAQTNTDNTCSNEGKNSENPVASTTFSSTGSVLWT
jgi:hypothetical protein